LRVYEADFPVPTELIGPGGKFELEDRLYRGQVHRMFRRGPRTLSELMARAMEDNRPHPDARMTEQDGVVTTYGEFEARAAALAAALRETLGVKPGDHVALAMANRAEWMIAFFAIVALGAVPVMVNSRGVGEEMHHAIRLADCSAAICDAERRALLAPFVEPSWPAIVLGGDGADLDFATASAPQPGLILSFTARDPEAIALIMFSSGTTGRPKAIAHAHGSMAHTLTLGCLVNDAYDALYEKEFGEALPYELRNSTSTTVMSSPLFHVAGILPYMRTIMNGQLTVLVTKWNAETVYDVLERETVSRLGLVPTMIFDMLSSPRAAGGALANIRYLANGTAPLAPEVAAKMRQVLPKCLMLNTFGQSETMERVATFGGLEFEANLGAVGRVMPTASLRIVRDDGSDVEPGEPGEIVARTPSVMLGYYNDAKATADTLRDGWVHTGDIGRFDEQRLLYIIDRKKNMVISGGENIYCAEVERVLADHPAAAEAIAYGEPDPRLGERLVAVVVLKPGATASDEEMKAYAKQRLAIYKVPRRVTFTHDPLPRNATGKVARGVFMDAMKTPA
jgi:acyl-CoA synthetase (AMP-forming)/AMP-acid ligase II